MFRKLYEDLFDTECWLHVDISQPVPARIFTITPLHHTHPHTPSHRNTTPSFEQILSVKKILNIKQILTIKQIQTILPDPYSCVQLMNYSSVNISSTHHALYFHYGMLGETPNAIKSPKLDPAVHRCFYATG